MREGRREVSVGGREEDCYGRKIKEECGWHRWMEGRQEIERERRVKVKEGKIGESGRVGGWK